MPSNPVGGDLNNTSVMRPVALSDIDPEYSYRSLSLTEEVDDPVVRKTYRPFILDTQITASDWISNLELSTVVKMAEEDILKTGQRLRVLVLYGSLRER